MEPVPGTDSMESVPVNLSSAASHGHSYGCSPTIVKDNRRQVQGQGL
jgi:hypothetical protein